MAGTMSTEADQRRPGDPAERVAVRVRRTFRGQWEVTLAGRSNGVPCQTLDEARRVAYMSAAHTGACELIVYDAYHRVVEHELIAG